MNQFENRQKDKQISREKDWSKILNREVAIKDLQKENYFFSGLKKQMTLDYKNSKKQF